MTVSATTRSPRAHEKDSVDYHFLTNEQFNRAIEQDAFLEWAHVHSNRYGTLKSEVEKYIHSGQSVILEIDPQGAFNVQKAYPAAVLIFIAPPSMDVLRERLIGRKSETKESLELRLADARQEMQLKDRYDAVLINDSLDECAKNLKDLMYVYETKGA